MAKYRILQREYPDGRTEYETQKKIFGLFWMNFVHTDGVFDVIYHNLEDAKMAIEIDKGTIKETIINV